MQNYQLGHKIGSGTTSQVFIATHIASQTPVALKIINKDAIQDSLESLKNQVEIHRQLSHQNIVSLFACFESDLDVVLCLELCASDLKAVLKPDMPFTIDQVRDVARGLIEGLSFIHSKSYVHRDLKLENVLIGMDGQIKVSTINIDL